MFTLFRKELGGFFATLTGYIVIIVFVTINSLFMWVFPGDWNILQSGYSSIEPLFILAPWVFLFLVPAITMRLFSDEKKSGTIEFLLTKPLSDTEIVLAKYLAGVALVLLSLIPTLIYFISVYFMGEQTGNIDTGGTWGSYIGLFFLSAIYVGIGVFTSAITDNQIVAFIAAVALSFFIYIGFDSLASLFPTGNFGDLILSLGISDHYKSISRGVVDSRDVIYFVSVVAIFVLATRLVLQSRKW